MTALVIWIIGAMFTDALLPGYPWYEIWLEWPIVLGNWLREKQ